MTLSSFKSHIKLSVYIALLVLYGLASFYIGRNSHKVPENGSKKISQKTKFDLPTDSPLPYADTQSGSVISASIKLCANTTYSYQLVYPTDWFTTYNVPEEQCSYFAPYSFIVPQNKDRDFVPIKVEAVKTGDWYHAVGFWENPNDLVNVISAKTMVVGDKAAERIELTSTGNGSVPRGYVKLIYLVYNSQTPIVFSYQQLSEKEDIKFYEEKLTEMVSSLKYF